MRDSYRWLEDLASAAFLYPYVGKELVPDDDPALLAEGVLRVAWARRHMGVLASIRSRFEEEQPFEGLTIGMALHVEAKTANLALALDVQTNQLLTGIDNYLLLIKDQYEGATDRLPLRRLVAPAFASLHCWLRLCMPNPPGRSPATRRS